MESRGRHEHGITQREGEPVDLTAVDQMTKWVAVAVSRRTLLKRLAMAGAAALSLQVFHVLPAAAESCNRCESMCGDCSTANAYCCSPNGIYCSPPLNCSCPPGCGACGCFKSVTRICDDDSRAFSCPQCASPAYCG